MAGSSKVAASPVRVSLIAAWGPGYSVRIALLQFTSKQISLGPVSASFCDIWRSAARPDHPPSPRRPRSGRAADLEFSARVHDFRCDLTRLERKILRPRKFFKNFVTKSARNRVQSHPLQHADARHTCWGPLRVVSMLRTTKRHGFRRDLTRF